MKIAPHSCNKLCREAITTVEHRKPEGVKLYYTSEVDDCYELSTDGQRVCQILINFLTNAEKHTTQGEIHLHCSLTENPGYVTFSVTDTGTGIPRNTRKPSSNVLKRPTTSGKAPAWDSISAASSPNG